VDQVHYFGPMDLTQKLLPLLRKSKGRVIFVGSFTALVSEASYSRCHRGACYLR
jgi:short-subunit dehydrogenase